MQTGILEMIRQEDNFCSASLTTEERWISATANRRQHRHEKQQPRLNTRAVLRAIRATCKSRSRSHCKTGSRKQPFPETRGNFFQGKTLHMSWYQLWSTCEARGPASRSDWRYWTDEPVWEFGLWYMLAKSVNCEVNRKISLQYERHLVISSELHPELLMFTHIPQRGLL